MFGPSGSLLYNSRHSVMRIAPLAALLVLGLSVHAVASTRIYNRRIEKEQTVARALYAAGLAEPQVEGIIGALQGVFDFRKSREGDQLRIVLRDGELDFFDYRQGPLDEWQVRRDGERLVGSRRELEVERKVAVVQLSVESSLYEAALASGEDP